MLEERLGDGTEVKRNMSQSIQNLETEGDKYEEPLNKKLKIEQTSDKHDYTNTRDKESSPKQMYVEDQCDYETKQKVNLRHTCDQCDYKTTHKGTLKTHVNTVHGNVRYSCDQCDYKATRKQSLKTHIDSVHGNVRYSCDKCDYQTTLKANLKRHINSVHGAVW